MKTVSLCLVVLTTVACAWAQSGSAARTPDGQPDLQGIWTNANLTPFERPRELGDKEFFTPAEATAYAARAREAANRDRRGSTPEEDVALSYNELWFDRGSQVGSNLRTSVVIDPKDGHVPPLTPAARDAAASRAAAQRRPPESPKDFAPNIRCIVWATAGPPMLPGPYNNNYQIYQTKDYVAINVEMIHDTRIVPLTGRPHPPKDVRFWMGDPVGHWEGETLVVDTANFRDEVSFRGSDSNLHLIERFHRTAPGTLVYQFTVDDPTAFAKPWTGEVVMTSAPGPVYEYACHEGNEALANMLNAASQQRARATAGK
jgi:hypothetical protein